MELPFLRAWGFGVYLEHCSRSIVALYRAIAYVGCREQNGSLCLCPGLFLVMDEGSGQPANRAYYLYRMLDRRAAP